MSRREVAAPMGMGTTAANAARTKPSFRNGAFTMGSLLRFFIPLGFAACLTTLTHSIIHSTLSQGDNPELIIAAYALGMSLLGITEKPAVLIRQTCSALVRDRASFKAMSGVTWMLIAATFALGVIVCYTPAGPFLFRTAFGADPVLVPQIIRGYQFLMWVSTFSAFRCLYHGVIISNMRTKWVTIGMIVRLIAMFSLSQYFIRTDQVNGAWVGAFIFATGMLIEAGVCWWEGRLLARRLPDKLPDNEYGTKRQIFSFYRPLLLSSFLIIVISPAINAMLGKTVLIELSIASFAVASNLLNVLMSLFTYIHQIVINFYPTSPKLVVRFQWIVGFLPCALTTVFAYTPVGEFVLTEWMGISGRLLPATLEVMKVFAILALLLPWIDFGNGFLMLFRRTHVFLRSQSANTTAALLLLFPLVALRPDWNGSIGALAMTAGSAAELAVIAVSLYRSRWETGLVKPPAKGSTAGKKTAAENDSEPGCETGPGPGAP